MCLLDHTRDNSAMWDADRLTKAAYADGQRTWILRLTLGFPVVPLERLMYASLVRPSPGLNLFSLKLFFVVSPSSTSCDTVGCAKVASLPSATSKRMMRSGGSPTAFAAA